jgi:hypothetical protein
MNMTAQDDGALRSKRACLPCNRLVMLELPLCFISLTLARQKEIQM